MFPASPSACLGLPALLPSQHRRETEARAQSDGGGGQDVGICQDKWRISLNALRLELRLSPVVLMQRAGGGRERRGEREKRERGERGKEKREEREKERREERERRERH